jgi:hypothetical protein
MGAIEAALRILLLDWSTNFVVAVVQRVYLGPWNFRRQGKYRGDAE